MVCKDMRLIACLLDFTASSSTPRMVPPMGALPFERCSPRPLISALDGLCVLAPFRQYQVSDCRILSDRVKFEFSRQLHGGRTCYIVLPDRSRLEHTSQNG